jgi:hypothetical protein
MRKKNRFQLAFTRHRSHPVASHLQSSPSQDSPSWKLYRQIFTLPLDHFITAYCDQHLSALVIEGTPPADELAKAWEEILEEWSERMQADDFKDIQDATREINCYKTTYNTIKTIVGLLEFFPVPDTIDELQPELERWLGFPCPLDREKKHLFLQQLEMAMGHATRMLTEALALEAQLPRPEKQEARRMDRDFFDEVIVSLSRFNKYKISKRETTVSEFTALVQDMRRGMDAARKIENN